jgi:hypothetical protein
LSRGEGISSFFLRDNGSSICGGVHRGAE